MAKKRASRKCAVKPKARKGYKKTEAKICHGHTGKRLKKCNHRKLCRDTETGKFACNAYCGRKRKK